MLHVRGKSVNNQVTPNETSPQGARRKLAKAIIFIDPARMRNAYFGDFCGVLRCGVIL
jgi:hypothetical protein